MEIKKVYINEETYPPLLKEIKDPPNPLYCAGDLSLLRRKCVALVGSRRTTEYGRLTARRMGRKLAECGAVIVSGMAKGIDTCAHLGALEAGAQYGGGTAAVLGCGADVCYPSSNLKLRDQIGKQGLILSEYPPGTQPARYRFPRRNRIISGLCEAVVVVQAPENSGALITAEMAAEQGRDVYAVPGPINSGYHLGSNKLLGDGALPLAAIGDLVQDLGLSKNSFAVFEESLGEDEKKLVAFLQNHGELTLDQLCAGLKKPVSQVSGMVTVLEIKGVLCTTLGKIFIAK